jgi:hypothetical protein
LSLAQRLKWLGEQKDEINLCRFLSIFVQYSLNEVLSNHNVSEELKENADKVVDMPNGSPCFL